ncbi:MAG: hypothetical protein KGP27_13510 [Hyphomicrobiales bacterium]|nr:hypothetical protein [Hyphomicrobiales bacterium]
MTKNKSKIRLRTGANVGELAAEDDAQFLKECFIDHPSIEALIDVRSHRSLLLGRTGSGKRIVPQAVV